MSNKRIRLLVQGVNKRFGGLQALSDVGLQIEEGQIYGLIGPNGAGKTTFFNVITGLYTPDSGEFKLDGEAYTPTAVYQVAKAGIARTFQNIRLFGGMGHIPGVILGAVLLSIFPEFLRSTMGPLQNALFGHQVIDTEVIRQLLYGLAMVVIMLYRSEGLWPAAKHEDKIAKLAKRSAKKPASA